MLTLHGHFCEGNNTWALNKDERGRNELMVRTHQRKSHFLILPDVSPDSVSKTYHGLPLLSIPFFFFLNLLGCY